MKSQRITNENAIREELLAEKVLLAEKCVQLLLEINKILKILIKAPRRKWCKTKFPKTTLYDHPEMERWTEMEWVAFHFVFTDMIELIVMDTSRLAHREKNLSMFFNFILIFSNFLRSSGFSYLVTC